MQEPLQKPGPGPDSGPFEQSPDYMQSLARGLEVLRSFDLEHPVMTLSQVAERVGLSRAVVRRCLLTLRHLGYLGSQGRQFTLRPRVLDLGFHYISSLSLPDRAWPFMEHLAQEVHESTSLSVLDDLEIVYVARVPARRIITLDLGVGARLPAFAASMGRVLLAGLPEPELDARLGRADLRPLTPHTLCSRAGLMDEIARVRRHGFSMVVDELEVGLCSVAVPIRDRSGRVAAALNLGLRSREGCREWATTVGLPALQAAQASIERTLALQPTHQVL